MKRFARRLGLIVCLVAGPGSPSGWAQPQRPQAELAADLISRDVHLVGAALNAIPLDIDAESLRYWKLADGFEASPELVAALIEALDDEATQYELFSIGEPHAGMPGEMMLSIIHTVIALDDPKTIPVLMRVTHTGLGVRNALLDFGPSVIDEALDCTRNPGRWITAAGGCLRLLSAALDRWKSQLAPRTLDRIKGAALKHLTCENPSYRKRMSYAGLSPLSAAVSLAANIGAPELAAPVQQLADGNPDAWRKCGFSEPYDRLQSKAQELLPLFVAQ